MRSPTKRGIRIHDLEIALEAQFDDILKWAGSSPDGNPGYFRQRLYVYERAGRPCRVCATVVRRIRQGQRSSYYCPSCQV